MFTSGQLLAERYRLERRIAVGGMGEVWEAADTRLGRNVAVKLLRPELCGDPEFLHRFRTEARMTASLNHPGIAAVHDYGETAAVTGGPEDTAYLVMELVEGEPLAAILARGGRLAADHALDILEQAGRALQAAHERGLVHRDIKPGNILVTPVGKVKVTDFGIAKAADAAPVTRSGMVMGTAHYIAPEQAVGQDAEPASDVYSLAVVGYECLAGRRPFLSENAVTVAMMHIRDIPPPLPPDVPPGARAVVEITLVKDPRQRYRSGGEFANAVAAVRSGHPLPPPSGLAMPFQGVAGLGVPPAMSPTVGGPGMTGHFMVPGPHLTGGLPPVGVHGPPSGPGGGVFPLAPPPPAPAGSGRRVGLWILVALLVALALVLSALGIREAVRSISKQGSPITGNTGRGLSGPGDTGRSAQPAISVQAQSEVSVNHGGYAGWQTTDTPDQSQWRGSRTGVGRWPVDLSHCIVNEVTPVGSIAIGSRVVMRHEPVVTG